MQKKKFSKKNHFIVFTGKKGVDRIPPPIKTQGRKHPIKSKVNLQWKVKCQHYIPFFILSEGAARHGGYGNIPM